MSLLGDMTVKFTADLSGLTAGISNAKSQISGFADSIERANGQLGGGLSDSANKSKFSLLDFGAKVGQTIFGLKNLADGALGVGKALLEPNAQFEQTKVGLEAFLGTGKKTQDFLNQLQDFANHSTFDLPGVATAAQHMLAFGFNARDVIPYLRDIGDAMGGLGQGKAAVDSVVMVLGQMKAATKVNAQDMMQLTSLGVPAWKILADSMHLSVAQVQQLSQQGKLAADTAIPALVAGMEKLFPNGQAKQAQTFLGILSTIGDKFGQITRTLTGPLFEEAKAGLSKFSDLLQSPGVEKFVNTIAKGLADAFSTIGTVIGHTGQAAAPFFDTLTHINLTPFLDILKAIAQFLYSEWAQNFQVAIAQVQKLGQFITGGLQPVLQQVLPAFQNLADALFTSVLPALAQMYDAGENLMRRIMPVLTQVIEAALPPILQLAGLIADGLAAAFRFLAPLVAQAYTALAGFAGDIIVRVAPLITRFFNDMNKAIDTFKVIWNAVWPALAPVVTTAFDMVKGAAVSFFAVLSGVVKTALDVLNGNWAGAWKDIQDAASGFMDGARISVGQSADKMQKGVSGSVSTLDTSVKGSINDMLNNGLGKLPGAFSQATSQFDNLKQVGISDFAQLDQQSQNYLRDLENFLANYHPAMPGLPGATRHPDTSNPYRPQPGAPRVGGAFASGILNSPIGQWALVGEKGPEMMFVPKGASIFPNDMASSFSRIIGGFASSIAGQASGVYPNAVPSSPGVTAAQALGNATIYMHNHVYLDGREMSEQLMARVDAKIRGAFGARSRVS